MRHLLFFFLLFSFILYYESAFSSNLKIVATIKPIHSLVASVTDGVSEPELLMYEVVSEHNYILRPSDASKLESSDIIFYVDDSLETFIKTFAKSNKKLIKLSSAIDLLPSRTRSFCNHIQDEKDFHIWLSPKNAKSMILSISSILSNIDKENTYRYNTNAKEAIRKIEKEVEKITKELDGLKNKKYVVTHDAYQYFEKYFNLNYPSAILSIEDDSYVGMKSFMKLKRVMTEENVKCIVSHSREDSIKPNIFSSDIKMVIVDSIGSDIEPGRDAYLDIISNVAQNFKSCFGK